MDMQYMAYWLNGDGTQHLMESDLPLSGVKVTREANGLGRLTASLPPEWGTKTGYNNRPVIQEWATAIYVEIAGDLFDGFIVAEIEDDNDKLTIDAIGWLGYADDQPWPDRANVYNAGSVRASSPIYSIWEHVQKLKGSNIGLGYTLGSASTWPIIGEPIWDEVPVPRYPGKAPKPTAGKQPTSPKYPSYTSDKKKQRANMKAYNLARKQYQADLKQWRNRDKADRERKKVYDDKLRQYESDKKERARMIEDAKFKMNYWSTHDLLSTFQSLMSEIGASYRVDHARSGNTHTHTLRCRPGTLGIRRTNVHFIEGENVMSVPKITQLGDEKVTSAVILGSGEGSSMKWLQRSRSAGGASGLRRARVFADKTLTRTAQLQERSKEVLNAYSDPISIDEFVVIDHGLAPIRTFDVGDEILLQTMSRRAGNIKRWVTIQTITLDPEKGVMSVKVSPVEQE